MIAFCGSQHTGEFLVQVRRVIRFKTIRVGISLWAFGGFFAAAAVAQDTTPPRLVFNPISISLESTGRHTLSTAEISRIAAGSSDDSAITNMSVSPAGFTFCDIGTQTLTLTLSDAYGNVTNRSGPIQVLEPLAAPVVVFVDARYSSSCGLVGFPADNPNASHFVGWDAFPSIQAAVDEVQPNGLVYIAAGTYPENVIILKPLLLIGPNAGTPGAVASRQPEGRLIPTVSDPENTPIISVESDDVVIDGLFLDGSNPVLSGGYNANGVRVHAAAGVQNGVYPDLADVEGITVRNCIITNISYDGICLDRYQYFGTSSGWNYIRNNKLANMWEGILTYALDSVISGNVISNVTHGLGVHCVDTAAPKGFQPLVCSNTLTIAQWWPVEIDANRAPGIWINYRRDRASPIEVVGNVVNTPVAAGPFKSIIGLYALTVDGSGKINFIDNTVKGAGNCTIGLLAASCWSNDAVKVLRCSLKNIRGTGVLADTLDAKWGPGNCFLTVSNVDVTLSPGGFGVVALQQTATPSNCSSINIIGNSSIMGGACGVQVRGTNASASVLGNGRPISGNEVGIHVDGGRALLEGNILTNNSLAAVWLENEGVLDAGDCSGANITGLGTGSGPRGASAGLNDFSGYGFIQCPPWAITNSGTVPVVVDRNTFNTPPGQTVRDLIAGPVRFSDSGILEISAPPAIEVECLGQVPVAAKTLEEFVAAGGLVTAEPGATISSRDLMATNRPGHYTLTRSYTIGGGCSPAVSCNQIIIARDNQGPSLHCSDNIVQGTDPGRDYATVTFTNLAADTCGELLGSWVPVSTGQFSIGTNTVIVVATDLANNSAACSFDIAVVAPPVIKMNPASRTNNIGTKASFKVLADSAAPLSFQWKRNEVALTDGGSISGATNAELVIGAVSESDALDYRVDVRNFAGTTSSTQAHLTVLAPGGNLRLVELLPDQARLAVTGPSGYRFGILTSTNLVDWLALYTNTAPFPFNHTNPTGFGSRFYRAWRAP